MNKAKPEVKLMLDKERTIRFDLNAMCRFEEVTGKDIFGSEINFSSAQTLRTMLWACLTSDDPNLTLEYVGSLISFDNMNEVAEKLQEAFLIAKVENLNEEITRGKPDKEAKEDSAPLEQ